LAVDQLKDDVRHFLGSVVVRRLQPLQREPHERAHGILSQELGRYIEPTQVNNGFKDLLE